MVTYKGLLLNSHKSKVCCRLVKMRHSYVKDLFIYLRTFSLWKTFRELI